MHAVLWLTALTTKPVGWKTEKPNFTLCSLPGDESPKPSSRFSKKKAGDFPNKAVVLLFPWLPSHIAQA